MTRALYAMLNWLSTAVLAKQVAKFATNRINALNHWHIVILEVDPVFPVDIDYLPAEYCLD